jgi:hypothetical protein
MAATTDRVLIEIQTVANTAGIGQAQAGMLGLSASTIALGAAVAGIVIVGKAALENYKALEDATLGLNQAYATQKDTLAAHDRQLQDFLTTNRRFISNQYDVMAALALVVRAGNNTTDAFKILNVALDLSAIKHEDVSVAAKALVLAEAGNAKALKELGISTIEYSAIMKDKKLTVEQKDTELLALIASKTKDGRNTTDQLTQSENSLNKSWQDFTDKIGPGVLGMLNDIIQAADILVQLLDLTSQYLQKTASYGPHYRTPPGSTITTIGPGSGPAPKPPGSGNGATIHVNGPVHLVSSAQFAQQTREQIRRLDRSQR